MKYRQRGDFVKASLYVKHSACANTQKRGHIQANMNYMSIPRDTVFLDNKPLCVVACWLHYRSLILSREANEPLEVEVSRIELFLRPRRVENDGLAWTDTLRISDKNARGSVC